MRSGYVDIYKEAGHQPLRGASVAGYAWSSSATEEAKDWSAYYLGFNASGVYPSNGPSDRRDGFPLRCLSTTAVGNCAILDS